jgi:glycosyltransferase involved in cell wall biosynthesis
LLKIIVLQIFFEKKMNLPILTVAICTHNRALILEECLRALYEQCNATDVVKILVVDNNSEDNTAEIADRFTKANPFVSYIFEPNVGLSVARNCALNEVVTQWIAFLDDDARVHHDWLQIVLDTIVKDEFDAFGGPFYAWYPFGTPPRWFLDIFETYVANQEYGLIQGDTYIPGGNCAMKVAVAKDCHGFSEQLGMIGAQCGYADEAGLFKSMTLEGFRLGYVPLMKIDHCVMPHKYKFSWHIRSLFARGRAHQRVSPIMQSVMPLRCALLYAKAFLRIVLQTVSPACRDPLLKVLMANIIDSVFYTGITYERYKGRK